MKHVKVADPFVFYDGETGKYYIYSTAGDDQNSDRAFKIYSSDDGIHFLYEGRALNISSNRRGKDWYRAPEVYHNATTGKYFMFYSSRLVDSLVKDYFEADNFKEPCKIGVAVASSPLGPFKNISSSPLDYYPFDENYEDIDEKKQKNHGIYFSTIDANLLIDDSEIYLTFSRVCYRHKLYEEEFSSFVESGEICGCKLDRKRRDDPKGITMPEVEKKYLYTNKDGVRNDHYDVLISHSFEPQGWEDLSLVKEFCESGVSYRRRWFEGSTLFKMGNHYGLTYSCNRYMSKDYAVGIAFSKRFDRGFKKSPNNPIISWKNSHQVVSMGHGSLIKIDEKIYYYCHCRLPSDMSERILCRCLLKPTVLPYGFECEKVEICTEI
jgi:beta-xylosidase